MAKSKALKCPRCGVEMNHHADKVVQPVTREQAAKADPALGGWILERHRCAACREERSRGR